MGDRVLNFSEFADKYSVDGDNTLGIDDMSTASDAFTDGFDDDSYDSPEIKPNRPVGSEDGITPPGPGEDEAPSFSADADSGMEAPIEGEEEEVIIDAGSEEAPIEGDELPTDIAPEEGEDGEAVAPEAIAPAAPPIDADEDGGDPEEDDEDEDDDDDEEEEEEEEATNESVEGLLESFDTFTQGQAQPIGIEVGGAELDLPTDGHEGHGHEEDEEDEECFVLCKHCGEKKSIPNGQYPFGAANQMDNTSWWKGKEGMSCGCK